MSAFLLINGLLVALLAGLVIKIEWNEIKRARRG